MIKSQETASRRIDMDSNTLKKQIMEQSELEITFPVLNNKSQETVHQFLSVLLQHYQRPDLMDTLYSILKELILNGVKANMKHHYFPDTSLSSEDLQCLKSLLNEAELQKFETTAAREGHFVSIHANHSDERLIFRVINSSPITVNEDRRIREKFQTALSYDSIAEYYMEHADDIEGSGLGITMIVLMLKANGVDPHAFTVDTRTANRTTARLEFPLKPDYTLTRTRD